MPLDRYATKHCPVICYASDGRELRFDSISSASKTLNISVHRLKTLIHYELSDDMGRVYDIPAEAPFYTVAQSAIKRGHYVERVRVFRRGFRTHEFIFLGGKLMILPLDSYVLIEKKQAENKTKSGLILTGRQDNETSISKVLKVGKTVKTVKEGHSVLFLARFGIQCKDSQGEYLLVDESNILAIVEA